VRQEKSPAHVTVRSRAGIKRTFTYSPYPSAPTELDRYAGSQVGGTGIDRLIVDNQGAVARQYLKRIYR